MTKDNSTGKNKDFYNRGKEMFDRIRVLPEHQAVPQIPQKHSSKRMTDVFKLIEANGLTLHGDIEHFAELVRADERETWEHKYARLQSLMEIRETQPNKPCCLAEREACAKVCDAWDEWAGTQGILAKAIRARGNT
jgi:hypothetical protein